MNYSIFISYLFAYILIPNNVNHMFINTTIAFFTSLVIYTIEPNQVKIKIPNKELCLIGFNIGLSILMLYLFLNYVKLSEGIQFIDLLYFALWVITEEIIFFFGHKYLHKPHIYKYIHKYHHKYITTNALTSFYAHPLDQIFVNISFMLAPFIMLTYFKIKCSFQIIYIFFIVSGITFINSHQTLIGNEKLHHLLHHLKFNCNYGNFYILDIIYGCHI